MHATVASVLHNVVEQVPLGKDGNPLFSRIPDSIRGQINDGAASQALSAAGVEIRCRVGENGGVLHLWVDGKEAVPVELYFGDYLLWTFPIGPGKHEVPLSRGISYPWLSWREVGRDLRGILGTLPRRRYNPELVRVVFPNKARVGLLDCTGDIFPALPGDVPQYTLLGYGSSITMGVEAIRMNDAYLSLVAEQLGCDCLNLGFAGSALCEESIADWIHTRDDWDIGLFEMGINMDGLLPDVFTSRIRSFVAIVGGKVSTRPVFAMDQFRHFNDLPGINSVRVIQKRQVVLDAVTELGGPKTQYIPVQDLPDISGLCADLLHPSPLGMHQMADSITRTIRNSALWQELILQR
ncbi:MAG: SGNH/GDSL hydrolase family protein [Verrucomicrobiota bacterium]|nr:SGNH/GDSL hydrolase family protein [Verrucomicrobiota bacterium]